MMRRSSALQLLYFLAIVGRTLAQPGFISIDCGLKENSNYTTSSGIVYSPDAGYVDGGVNVEVPKIAGYTLGDRYWTMRSFPNGTRNCYSVWPVTDGTTYLVRAGFFYGNYDGRNSPPKFDLYLGVNFWTRVETLLDDTVLPEIMVLSPANSLEVCLVNTASGTPFISVLEVRPVQNSLYTMVNTSHSLVLREKRVDYGGNVSSRYPDDSYDRIWFPSKKRAGWTPVSTDKDVTRQYSGTSSVPLAVFKTAIISEGLSFSVTVATNEKIVLFMYFAELEELAANETREFNVLYDGKLWYGPYRPTYLKSGYMYTAWPGMETTSLYTLNSTSNSTRPPIINAREAYGLKRLESSATDSEDRGTMSKIKDAYGVRKNWQGDPCLPSELSWEGVGCRYDASKNPEIISLNLSGSGLKGGISPSLVNLKALISLDLSNNNLTGPIPEELATLKNLEVLKLANNQLSGPLPDVFYRRSKSGALLLSIDGNVELCKNLDLCQAPNNEIKESTERKKPIVPIVAAISVSFTFLVGVGFLIWWVKRKKLRTDRSAPEGEPENPTDETSQPNDSPRPFKQQNHQFSYADIVSITKNFGRLIGKGGFATVYHGSLNDGTEVAVKLLSRSSRGRKDFHTEGQILSIMHHRNLVRLLGYCEDKDNLALVYEYMRQGSLAEHLRGEREGNIHLDWNMRLRIAVDVAQGLEYLHNFCNPPIIHRDVKTRNILLNEQFEAKLGDFGLSKMFSGGNDRHMSTIVAGTPGYLDPEYHQTSHLNEMSDVYSFGIVLLEIITGQAPMGNVREGPLLPRVKSRVERGDIESIVDKRLIGGFSPNSMWKALEIAIKCSSPSSVHRPQMSEVVSELKECLESEASREKSYQSSIQMPKSHVSLSIPTAR